MSRAKLPRTSDRLVIGSRADGPEPSRVRRLAMTAAMLVVVHVSIASVAMAAPQDFDEDLLDLDLEQLLQIKVTSVAGREQSLQSTPAAIFVITGEDIRRTGHRTIAEALRMVPGFNVARISPSVWAIGSRGFQDRFANDLLVLIDGRTIYDPLFSGVFWNVQDVLLEDLERIEVIRGPGATLWGANAVNGVVNITTKSAADTHGLFVQGGGGTELQGFGAVRFGDAVGEDTHFRVYAKYDNFDHFDQSNGRESPTDWDMWRAGFRIDHVGADDIDMTLQGDVYETGHISDRVRVPQMAHLSFGSEELDEMWQGSNVLFRMGRTESEQQGWSFRTYYDRTKTRAGRSDFEVRRDTFDFDFRRYDPLGANDEHTFMWGVGYRHSRDRTQSSSTLTFSPRTRGLDTYTAFLQDTITLVPDRLSFMIGSKLEHNDHTGFEFQPSGRLSWTPDADHTVWAAVSRAVRTPSRIADDVRLTTAFADTGLLGGGAPSGIFVPLQLTGNDDLESEELIAYELGFRAFLHESFSVDVATFYNDYDETITFAPGASTFGNRGTAETYGVEVATTWEVADNWRLSAAYTFLEIDAESPDGNPEETESPEQQFNVRSEYDLTADLEFNSALYWVDEVPDENAGDYFRLDLGVTWRPRPNVEIAVWGQNLLDGHHYEFGDDLFIDVPLEVERGVYAQVSLKF